jgi:hypothetical protein
LEKLAVWLEEQPAILVEIAFSVAFLAIWRIGGILLDTIPPLTKIAVIPLYARVRERNGKLKERTRSRLSAE